MFKLLLRPLSVRYIADKASTGNSKPKLSSKLSNTPRPPKDPPDKGYEPQCVQHSEIEVPDYVRPKVFRQFGGPNEKLGPGAGKSKEYKASHYFGYHRFSFVELQNQGVELRNERRATGGLQESTETEEEEFPDGCLETIKKREAECEQQLAAQAKDSEEQHSEDGKKQKLEDRCKQIQLKQKQTDTTNNLGRTKLEEWCKRMEKKQQDKKEKLGINKRVTDILSECADKLTKTVALVADTNTKKDDKNNCPKTEVKPTDICKKPDDEKK